MKSATRISPSALLRALALFSLSTSLLSAPVSADSLVQSRDALRKQGCPGYTQFLRKQAAAGDAWSQAQLISLDVVLHPCGDPDRSAASTSRLLEMAAAGNPAAKTRAGQAYLQGRAVPKDLAKGMTLLREASEQGETGATYNLGLANLFGWAGEKNPQAAQTLFEKLVASGHLYGDLGMGLLALQGDKPDTRLGYGWLEKAARKGDPYAQRLLGNAYEQGAGDLKRDDARAAQYYRDAAALLDWPAQVALGRLTLRGQGVKKDAPAAARLFEAAARQGGSEAVAQIAQIYYQGAEGTPPDYVAAAPWLTRAAAAGDGVSAKLLGWLNETGNGVAKSEAEARRFYRQASDHGDNWSAFRLYQLMYKARQSPAERAAAMLQLERAASLGHPKAQLILAQAYDLGQDKPQDKAQAARWWKAAAEAGDAVGMHNLGVAYLKGTGVPHSGEEAMKWFGKASVAGHGEALNGFKEAYRDQYKNDTMLPGKILELAQAGSLDAIVEMSTRGEESQADRLKWLRLAADRGHAVSQYILAGMYWNGSAELPQDRKLAIDWMRRSAESGYWGAYAWFAELNSGSVAGFAKNVPEAETWYRQGIEKIRDETGKSLLRDQLAEFQQRERQARWAEQAAQARLERQTGNLPPEASDIQPLLLAAWAKHLNKGELQADGTFSKTDPLLGMEWARNEMSVEDVSCVKDLENNKCGGYKCDFAARVRAVGGLAGIFGELSDGRITKYRLHFHWTRTGLEAPNLDKVMEEQAEVEQSR